METNITPEWVVKNFLPDYENRLNIHLQSEKAWFHKIPYEDEYFNGTCFTKYEWEKFQNEELNNEIERWEKLNFSEALENLLKAQREKCAASFICNKGNTYVELSSILNAPVPKPINNK